MALSEENTRALAKLEERHKERVLATSAYDESGAPIMTPERLRVACSEHGGYTQPALNDRLYLHFAGYRRIENLEPFTGLRALWLDSNGLSELRGLSHLAELRCLFLQQNLLTRLTGLEGLAQLTTLNVSSNNLTSLEGLAALPALTTLHASKNALAGAGALLPLRACASLAHLDVGDNELPGDGDNSVLGALGEVPRLRNLVLKGNPVCRDTKHYRKTALTALPRLRYLDDRPVFTAERAAVDAWAAGGAEAERAAIAATEEAKRSAARAGQERFAAWAEGVREKRRAELAALNAERAGAGLPAVTELPAKRHVQYTTASTRFVTEAMVLARTAEAAEAAYRAGSLLPGEAAGAAEGARFTVDGIVGEDGVEAARDGGSEGGVGGGGGGGAGEEAEAEAEKELMEVVCRREREAREREGARAAEVKARALAALRAGTPAAPAAAAAAAAAAAPPSPSSTLVTESLRLFNAREAASVVGGGEGKEEGAAEGTGEEVGAEEEEEEAAAEREEERREEEARALREERRLVKAREWEVAGATLAKLTAEREARGARGEGSYAVAAAAAFTAAASPRAVPRRPQPEEAPAPAPIPAPVPAPAPVARPVSEWHPALDAALRKLAQQAAFDFDKTARGLRNAGASGVCARRLRPAAR
jgi:dynein assembly factor 1